MTSSSYHDPLTDIDRYTVGAWDLEVGVLPDGRYAIDYWSPAGSRQRRYFATRDEATKDAAWLRHANKP